jgi:diguanylate cyclase (GGDEF)-like protein/PAS domain S-box-containing protein
VTIRDRNGVYLFKEFNKAINNDYKAGYANYLWYNKDGIIDQKTSYVRLLNGWDLVVGTGFYHSSIDKLIIKKQALLEKFLKQDLIKMSIILLVLFLSTTAIAIYISNKTKKLEEEEEEHLAMLENYKIALDESSIVTITDINGKIEYVNEQFCRVSGYCDNDIIGLSHKIVRHENTPKETFKELWETISSGNIWKGVIKNKTKTGESYYNSATIVPLKDIKGDITGFISISYNVTELIENKEKLENIFLTDRLTSLGSRFKLLQELDNSNEQTNLLALIDIDSFRGINNLYGQEFGDEVIKIVANLIFKALEKYDYKLFRIHADVFAVLSRGDRFTIFLEKIKHAVDDINSNTVNIKSQKISISFTTSFARGDSNVLAYADSALKSAKKNKKLFEVYSDDIQITKEYEDNIYWVNTLKQAFKDDLIFPFYQPIYNYHTGKIEKYECLVRMINDGKIVSPNSFLDVAKKTKLYSKITITVIEKVINKFKNLDYEFSINLSVEDLLNSETMDFLYSMAKKENIFKRMVIEIVESEELQSFDEIHNILQRFKKAGSKIAIDDFGSGYSTFDYLIYLNADYVKIDGSIVKLIEKDERAKDIVKSIIEFAKKSNMKTIAEYVSSVEIDTIVSELGVDYAQGFYRGKPAEDIIY